MTKKYFVTKDMVDSSISATSENPVQNKVIKQALDAKLDIQQAVSDQGKVPTADSTGKLVMTALPAATKPDWTAAAGTAAEILNKPFTNIGTGLTVKEVSGVQTLTANTQFKFQIFATLPTPAAEYAQTIALILKATTETGNVYDEYGCVSDPTVTPETWTWEKLGAIKATVTQSATAIEVDGVALQTASDAQIGLMSAADHADMQRKANLVTAFQTTTSDTKYPSEKLVKDNLDLKQTIANKTATIAAAASASDDKYPTEKATRTELDARVQFASGSTSTAFTVGVDATGYYIEE